MKPESLLGLSLELIQKVALPGAYPADARVGRFFRERRYLGSRDRRFISEAVYAWLRHSLRARALWKGWAMEHEIPLPSGEEIGRIEGDLALQLDLESAEDRAGEREDQDQDQDNGDRRSEPSSDERREAHRILRSTYVLDILSLARDGVFPWSFEETLSALGGLPIADDPLLEQVRAKVISDRFPSALPLTEDPVEQLAMECSLPRWVASRLLDKYGPTARDLGRAFLKPASVDLRVNLRLQDREKVRRGIAKETGKGVDLTPFSPLGVRLAARVNLTATTASRKNWVEVQGEGSQIVVLSTDPKPGMTVIDVCAGGGGKTLAFADILFRQQESVADVPPESRIHACEIAREKLGEIERRSRDVGLEDRIQRVHFYPSGPLPPLPQADLVFVDAPCTGVGTLRRNPELKRRYGEEDAASFARLQLSILERVTPLVKEGGRLSYVTCSFLSEECEEVAIAFESHHPEFEPSPLAWAAEHLPPGCVEGHRLRLDPLLTGTDAFFLACWIKRATPE